MEFGIYKGSCRWSLELERQTFERVYRKGRAWNYTLCMRKITALYGAGT